MAAGVGGGLSVVASGLLVVYAFELPFAPPLLEVIGLGLATFAVTALFGGLSGAGRPLNRMDPHRG